MLQDRGPLPEISVRSEVVDTSGKLAANRSSENALPAEIQFPLATPRSGRSMAATGISLMPSWQSVLRPATTALGTSCSHS